MPDIFYDEMDELFRNLSIEVEDTNDKATIIDAENFVATFTPEYSSLVIA